MTQGIIELYLQGMKPEEVKQTIDQELEKASSSIFRLRLVHGIDNSTDIRDMIYDHYQPESHPKIIRVEDGWNEGITELVLKDY